MTTEFMIILQKRHISSLSLSLSLLYLCLFPNCCKIGLVEGKAKPLVAETLFSHWCRQLAQRRWLFSKSALFQWLYLFRPSPQQYHELIPTLSRFSVRWTRRRTVSQAIMHYIIIITSRQITNHRFADRQKKPDPLSDGQIGVHQLISI